MKNCIKQARQARGVTQDELAERLGVGMTTVSRWETGTSEPNASMLCLMADVLDVSTDQLTGRKPLIAS